MHWLIDTDTFVPFYPQFEASGHAWLAWLHIISNIIIAIMYIVIARGLIIIYEAKKHDPSYKAIFYFSLSKFCGGLIFLINTIMFWFPYYKLYTLIKILTAFFSCITIYYLIPVVSRFVTYKTPEEYQAVIVEEQKANNKLKEVLKEVQKINHELANRVQYLENIAYTQGWVSRTELKLTELRKIVTDLRKNYLNQ